MTSINHFTDLKAWQLNHEFVKQVYRLTKNFPADEQFGLTSQLRRSASSITANIAEAYGRHTMKDKQRFFYIARGSSTETQNHLILAYQLGYMTKKDYDELQEQVFVGFKVLCGLIRSTEKNIHE